MSYPNADSTVLMICSACTANDRALVTHDNFRFVGWQELPRADKLIRVMPLYECPKGYSQMDTTQSELIDK